MTGRLVLFLGLVVSSTLTFADDLWLSTAHEFPGRIRISEGGTSPRVLFSRNDSPNPAYPLAEMKVANIAIGIDNAVYYCSGLDRSLMTLLDGRHEIQLAEASGQVRDLACTSEPHCVYYSIVPTPQGNERLADGLIMRRDFWEGQPQVVAAIHQSDVGGNWWGVFTIRDSEIYLATHDRPSRIFKWSAGRLGEVYQGNRYNITGLTVDGDGDFLFVEGSGEVWRTRDFEDVRSALTTDLSLTDVAGRALSTTVRP